MYIRSFLILFIAFFSSAWADCPFCRQTVLEQQSVYEGEHLRVLVDYEPRVKGHLLVVTKRHLFKIHELSKEEWEEMATVIPKIVQVFSAFLGTDQYVVIEKNGPNAYQQIPHVHFHVIPILSQPWLEVFGIKPKRLSREELEEEVQLFKGYFQTAGKDFSPLISNPQSG